jgi:hypothetical protein
MVIHGTLNDLTVVSKDVLVSVTEEFEAVCSSPVPKTLPTTE